MLGSSSSAGPAGGLVAVKEPAGYRVFRVGCGGYLLVFLFGWYNRWIANSFFFTFFTKIQQDEPRPGRYPVRPLTADDKGVNLVIYRQEGAADGLNEIAFMLWRLPNGDLRVHRVGECLLSSTFEPAEQQEAAAEQQQQ